MTNELEARLRQAQQTGQGAFTEAEFESFTTEDLRLLTLAESALTQRADELLNQKAIVDADQLDRRFEEYTPEEIQNELTRKTAQQRLKEQVQESPVHQAEEQRESLAKEVENLQYIKDQMQHETDDQLNQKIRDNVAKEIANQNAVQNSLELQRMWCDKHPEYVRDEFNGNQIRDYVAARYPAFTFQNLEEAYGQLHDKLHLSEQRQQEPETPRTVRRSSSVPTKGGSLYDHHESSIEELESMPMDKFLEIGRRTGMIDPDAEMSEGVRKSHTSFLPQF